MSAGVIISCGLRGCGLRGGRSDRLALPPLFAALYLATALTVSATFLLVFRDLGTAVSGGYLTDYSQVQLGQGSGGDGTPLSWAGSKRLRGVLQAKVSVQILRPFAAVGISQHQIESAAPGHGSAVAEPESKALSAVPHELLRRPPPSSSR